MRLQEYQLLQYLRVNVLSAIQQDSAAPAPVNIVVHLAISGESPQDTGSLSGTGPHPVTL